MPFANLLTLSYTGSLGPLRSVPEEKNKRIAEEVEPTEEETVEEEKSSEVERRSDDTISVDLEHSQQTVVDDVMNETMKPPRYFFTSLSFFKNRTVFMFDLLQTKGLRDLRSIPSDL